MRVFYMANNLVGWRLAEWLREQNAEIVGAALHPEDKSRYAQEIRAALRLPADVIFDASALNEPQQMARIKRLKPEIGVSIYFGYILKPTFLELFPAGVVNLHPSYLPFNRGANPNVWSIVDGAPAGVTLHYIDQGIDTGDIIARERVGVAATDTGASLYRKLETASIGLFQRTWPEVAAGVAVTCPQPPTKGITRRMRDLRALDEIDLKRAYVAGELIDVLRARTFPPYRGAYFYADDGRKVYLRLQLQYEEELEQDLEAQQ